MRDYHLSRRRFLQGTAGSMAVAAGDILASLWPLALIALVSLTMAIIFVRGRLQ